MIKITLPDDNILQFESEVTGAEIAKRIGPSLLKAALAIELDGLLQDLDVIIRADARIRIITAKDKEGLEILRHDTAHILAHAVKDLYPETQITIGPNIENGFYYDFARAEPFSSDDFALIEKRMQEIILMDLPINREVWQRNDAIDYFKNIGEYYKAELIESFPEEEPISVYRQGDFIDLCRGPHSPSTGKQKAFKLMKLAGAYWRGDSRNPMLQRIYGTAWPSKAELEQYLTQLAEIERRDHRKLGKELDLFHIEDESSGMIFWHAKGWTLFRVLEDYIRQKISKHGYIEVRTPIVLDNSLWQKSGHWDQFRENMFIVPDEEKIMALKPMNCPCHIKIFNQTTKSYRDLPLRMAEFGACHRNEASGALHGLLRTRAFVQDDAHIFCTEEQITEETINFCQLLKEVYNELGFYEILIRFSDRPAKRAGSEETWDKAEKSLLRALEETKLVYEMNPGEGAFYGPKLEFVLKDATGRLWQCGTLQVDLVLPERLGATYVESDGNKYPPVMLHRAMLGSLERFIGILIEQYAGWLPFWLSPIQAIIATITSEAIEYAKFLYTKLNDEGIRCGLDISNDKISYKIRAHTMQKIPYILILGKKEMEQESVAIRTYGNEQQYMTIEELVVKLKELQHLKGV